MRAMRLPPSKLPRVGTTRLYPPLPPLVAGAIQGPVYRAERFRISLQVKETPWEHDGLRPLGIEVPSLAFLEAQSWRGQIARLIRSMGRGTARPATSPDFERSERWVSPFMQLEMAL